MTSLANYLYHQRFARIAALREAEKAGRLDDEAWIGRRTGELNKYSSTAEKFSGPRVSRGKESKLEKK